MRRPAWMDQSKILIQLLGLLVRLAEQVIDLYRHLGK